MAGKILVAEDDPEARAVLMLLLSGGGEYDLLQAGDGVEALDLLRSEQPDLLITDVVMPRMDGYELVRRVREDDRLSNLPVIFCSASYHEREVREMARSLGALQTIAKPYDAAHVRSAVSDALAARTQQLPPISEGLLHSPEVRLRAAQARLNAMATFSRNVFARREVAAIVETACHALREIMLAQVAQVVIADPLDGPECVTCGLDELELQHLLSNETHKAMQETLRQGGYVQYPLPSAGGQIAVVPQQPATFASMLGLPLVSANGRYGWVSVVNRLGLSTFNEEDLAVLHAIAAQIAAAYENAQRQSALRREVDQRTRAELEAHRLNQELEERVAERTAELEIANRELEAFSYSVAHDLRAPLRLIHAQVQMLIAQQMGPIARPVRVQLEQIQRGATHMSSLIDGMLTLARVGHTQMNPVRLPLMDLLSQAQAVLEPGLRNRDIEWRTCDLPDAYCDPELMRQVFVNLLDNAVKYSSTRPRTIIEIGYATDEGEPHVYVRDNGVGFDPRYSSKLFGLFQRLHRQDEFEGTGVGLATVARILQRHGGRIWAQSEPGQGAVFRFSWPGLNSAGAS